MTGTTLTPGNAQAFLASLGGLEVKPVSNEDRGLVLGIFAPGGTGKTTLAASITHSKLGGPALLLNARGNPHVISSYGLARQAPSADASTGASLAEPQRRVDVIDLEKFNQQEEVRAAAVKMGADFPYKSVIIDNVTELWARRLMELYGPIGDVDWTKHSATTADVIQLVRNWMDLAERQPKVNVIFVFQETPEERTIRNMKTTRSELMVNKALQAQLPPIVNFLGRLYIESDTEPFRRMLDFTPAESVQQSKFQVDPRHPEAGKIPKVIYNPDLGTLLDTIRYSKPWPVEKHDKKAQPEPLR